MTTVRCILPFKDPSTGKTRMLDFPSHDDALAWLRRMTEIVERDQASFRPRTRNDRNQP